MIFSITQRLNSRVTVFLPRSTNFDPSSWICEFHIRGSHTEDSSLWCRRLKTFRPLPTVNVHEMPWLRVQDDLMLKDGKCCLMCCLHGGEGERERRKQESGKREEVCERETDVKKRIRDGHVNTSLWVGEEPFEKVIRWVLFDPEHLPTLPSLTNTSVVHVVWAFILERRCGSRASALCRHYFIKHVVSDYCHLCVVHGSDHLVKWQLLWSPLLHLLRNFTYAA